ncbi:glycosyl transferase [Acidobacteria bacterium AB60]|nr:glycosyl transferase [Acidobacteria bacterium AB60]
MNETISILDAQRVLNGDRIEAIKQAARSSGSWDVSLRPTAPGKFQERVLAARSGVEHLEKELARLPDIGAGNKPIIGLLDLRSNPRLLRAAVAAVTPQPRDRDNLPRVLLSGNREEPRVATLAATYLDAVGGEISAPGLALFANELQANEPLLLVEIWNIPAYLNFVLLERILAIAKQSLAGDAHADTTLRTLFSSLRTSTNTEWSSILESLIVFDAILRQDPTGTYPKMDLETRQQYRNRVALIASNSDFTESHVAAQALELAQEGARGTYTDPRKQQRCSHIGYYLIDKGFGRLATCVNFHPPVSFRLRSFIRRNADDFYITSIELVTIFVIAAAVFPLLPNYPVFGRLAITFLLMIMPAMQCAVELANNSVTSIYDPESLPKLDFSERIPAEATTLVVVPTLLLNEKQTREMVNELEVRFLANRDPNLHFALLTDLPDSVSKPHAHDSNPLVDLAVQLINDLNTRYASPNSGSFLFLHRHRIFNVRQGVWMGWERKRGKLLDLNKLLVGEYDAFPIKAGRLEALRAVRYILTLDSDTQLPRGSAAKLVGAIAHPLNQAVIDPKLRVVVEGYGILQPRVGVSVSSASRSRLAALYSGQSGFDIYTRAISDAYQDLYGEGIFTGKGIYEVAALHAVLNRRFPRNTLLSHDLIEGSYARAGLITDVELIDDYPSHYSAYTRRKHRWVRGDWQIARWMFSRVPDESNHLVPNPISTISRWKIFDNLRRSLVEPFTFILFVAGWLWLPGGPVYWTIAALLLFFLPTIVQTAFGLGRAILSRREGAIGGAMAGAGHAALLTLLNLFFLPHQAMLVLDAVLRALIRRFITGERLLEWETAAEAESQAKKSTPVDRYLALMPVIACSLAVIIYLFAPHHAAFLVAAPILLGWCMSTVLTAWLNRPPREVQQLNSADRNFLLGHALRIWRYFHQFGGESHNYLIPDNVEENGLKEAARVSPTNIGLLLNARQAACEFGFLTVPEFTFLTQKSLETIGRLEKLRGHLYNWFDTRTCQPLEANPFVSSVDSGNFVASLYTVAAGTRSLLRKPLLSRQLFAGLRTHWDLVTSQGKLSPALSKISLPGHSATISEWLSWLPAATTALASSTPGTNAGNDPWWNEETSRRIAAVQMLVHDFLPWLDPQFAPLREVSEYDLNASSELLSIDQAALFAEMLERRLAPDSQLANDTRALASQLHALLPSAIRNLRDLAAALHRVAHAAQRFAEQTEFGFLVNPGRNILSIGYDVRNHRVHDASYDMLASEARIATFLAIARGELPQQSWFKLARDHTFAFGSHIIMSWTGTMFEYLMPALWMRSYPNTMLADTLQSCVRVQQAFARSVGIPWGISESGSARRDDAGNYGYFAYGVPHIALSNDATAGPVVSPYSTFLALMIDPAESIRNLRHMASAGWVGAYGFYEATDYTTSTHRGDLVREWMAHHQGMSLLALLNCLCDNIVQEWFHANALIQSSELLLHETQISKAALKAMMKDFAFIPPKAAAAA